MADINALQLQYEADGGNFDAERGDKDGAGVDTEALTTQGELNEIRNETTSSLGTQMNALEAQMTELGVTSPLFTALKVDVDRLYRRLTALPETVPVEAAASGETSAVTAAEVTTFHTECADIVAELDGLPDQVEAAELEAKKAMNKAFFETKVQNRVGEGVDTENSYLATYFDFVKDREVVIGKDSNDNDVNKTVETLMNENPVILNQLVATVRAEADLQGAYYLQQLEGATNPESIATLNQSTFGTFIPFEMGENAGDLVFSDPVIPSTENFIANFDKFDMSAHVIATLLGGRYRIEAYAETEENRVDRNGLLAAIDEQVSLHALTNSPQRGIALISQFINAGVNVLEAMEAEAELTDVQNVAAKVNNLSYLEEGLADVGFLNSQPLSYFYENLVNVTEIESDTPTKIEAFVTVYNAVEGVTQISGTALTATADATAISTRLDAILAVVRPVHAREMENARHAFERMNSAQNRAYMLEAMQNPEAGESRLSIAGNTNMYERYRNNRTVQAELGFTGDDVDGIVGRDTLGRLVAANQSVNSIQAEGDSEVAARLDGLFGPKYTGLAGWANNTDGPNLSIHAAADDATLADINKVLRYLADNDDATLPEGTYTEEELEALRNDLITAGRAEADRRVPRPRRERRVEEAESGGGAEVVVDEASTPEIALPTQPTHREAGGVDSPAVQRAIELTRSRSSGNDESLESVLDGITSAELSDSEPWSIGRINAENYNGREHDRLLRNAISLMLRRGSEARMILTSEEISELRSARSRLNSTENTFSEFEAVRSLYNEMQGKILESET